MISKLRDTGVNIGQSHLPRISVIGSILTKCIFILFDSSNEFLSWNARVPSVCHRQHSSCCCAYVQPLLRHDERGLMECGIRSRRRSTSRHCSRYCTSLHLVRRSLLTLCTQKGPEIRTGNMANDVDVNRRSLNSESLLIPRYDRSRSPPGTR